MSGKALTRKQAAIMDRLCAGDAQADIARETGMAQSTVHTHVRRAVQKLGADSTEAAIVIHGWLRLEVK